MAPICLDNASSPELAGNKRSNYSNGRRSQGEGDALLEDDQASASLLEFDFDDLDEDVALLSAISSCLAQSPSKKMGSDRDACTTTDGSQGATALSDVNTPGKQRKRRKRTRRNCSVADCNNRVVQGGVCVAHGAKRKLCKVGGCDKAVKKAGYCSSHGPARKKCEVPGCSRVAVQGGICIGHGAKQTTCSLDGCRRKALENGLCKGHSGTTAKANEVPAPMSLPITKATPESSCEVAADPLLDPFNVDLAAKAQAPMYEIANSAVAAAIAQAPPPSLEFQKTMYARGLSIFEEMGVTVNNGNNAICTFGKPLPPPPLLPHGNSIGSKRQLSCSSFTKELQSLCEDDFDFTQEVPGNLRVSL